MLFLLLWYRLILWDLLCNYYYLLVDRWRLLDLITIYYQYLFILLHLNFLNHNIITIIYLYHQSLLFLLFSINFFFFSIFYYLNLILIVLHLYFILYKWFHQLSTSLTLLTLILRQLIFSNNLLIKHRFTLPNTHILLTQHLIKNLILKLHLKQSISLIIPITNSLTS